MYQLLQSTRFEMCILVTLHIDSALGEGRGGGRSLISAIQICPALAQLLNSPFFPPHIGAEPVRAKRSNRERISLQDSGYYKPRQVNMLLLCVCHLYCLVVLTFRIGVIYRYDDNTFGHALGSCWRDFLSFVNDFE